VTEAATSSISSTALAAEDVFSFPNTDSTVTLSLSIQGVTLDTANGDKYTITYSGNTYINTTGSYNINTSSLTVGQNVQVDIATIYQTNTIATKTFYVYRQPPPSGSISNISLSLGGSTYTITDGATILVNSTDLNAPFTVGYSLSNTTNAEIALEGPGGLSSSSNLNGTGSINIYPADFGSYTLTIQHSGGVLDTWTFTLVSAKNMLTVSSATVLESSGPAGIKTDSQGNIYVASNGYSGTLTNMDGSSTNVTLNVAGNSIVKYNSSGVVQWATYVTESTPINLAIDSSNNVYITGQYNNTSGTVTLQDATATGQTNSSISLPQSIGSDSFLVKYSSSGIVQWATSIKGSGTDISYALAVDSSNNVYFSGYYSNTSGTLTLQDATATGQTNSAISLPQTTGSDAFLVKYSSSGIVQWATSIKGSSFDIGYALAVDSSNNVYFSGYYSNTSGTLTLQDATATGQTNSAISLPQTTGSDAFLVKYSSSGIVQWATNIKGSGSDIGYALTVDSSNNVYITGQYNNASGTVTLQDATATGQTNSAISLPQCSTVDAFLVKYSSSGIVQWATSIKGSSSDIGYATAIDSFNNVYITGQYTNTSGTVTLQDATATGQTNSAISLPQSSGTDAFLVKYSSSGIVQLATSIKGTNTDLGRSLAINSLNQLYLYGSYFSVSSVTLQNASGNSQANSAFSLPISSGTRCFIVKYI
jgi:hypothetical protein